MTQTRIGTAALLLAVGMTAGLAGCASDDVADAPGAGTGASGQPSAQPSAQPSTGSATAARTPGPAGPFDAAGVIGKGYAVVTSTAMPLGPAGEPDYRVVVSAHRRAVAGGTQDVQVFAYRDGAWTEVFDAADRAVPFEFQGDYGLPEADRSPDPVLNQKHRIEHVAVQPVRFGLPSPSLLIFGEDKDNPEVLGLLAVVDFVTGEPGQAHLDHFEIAQDLNAPTVTAAGDVQKVEVPNYWYPWLNGGDPTRYTRTIGLSDSAAEGVTVLADSRPWIGAWVGLDSQPGVTVRQIVPGSPAEGRLEEGDRIISLNGNHPSAGLGPELLALSPGDHVTLTVERAGKTQQVTLTLADYSKAPRPAPASEKDPAAML